MTDSTRVAERMRTQRRILAAREAAAQQGALEAAPALEAAMPDDAPTPRADEVFDRIDRLIKAMPPGEVGDPQAFAKAVELLHRYGDAALRKLTNLGPAADGAATIDDVSALEAVVIADGSRPSFLLKDGLPPVDHPFLGNWANDVAAFRHKVQHVAKAIGRVQPTGGHPALFVGTASLVDRDKKLALTNYHVLDDARSKLGIAMTQNDRAVTVQGPLEVDFVGEADSTASNRFKVVEATLPKGFGRGFGCVDAALLKLEPVNERSLLPAAAVKLSSDQAYMTGDTARLPSLCTIGFPGPPPKTSGTTGEVDWSFVTATLFGNRFGLKRLAPGSFHRSLGSDPRDTLDIVFEHNATTFSGASGSLMVAWKDEGPPSFGLHFGGETEKANWAISIAAAVDALRAIGVPVQ
jgi:serine protease